MSEGHMEGTRRSLEEMGKAQPHWSTDKWRKLCLESSCFYFLHSKNIYYNAKIPWFWVPMIQHSLIKILWILFSWSWWAHVSRSLDIENMESTCAWPSLSYHGQGWKEAFGTKRPHAFALQSASQLDPVFSALGKETKENADRALASTNESFPWAEWMPSPVQPPGQHQHWVNTETNLCEIKTHFYMVPWHQDRHFLPTKQAQLSCYALWPLLLNERLANSLNPFRAPKAGDKEE